MKLFVLSISLLCCFFLLLAPCQAAELKPIVLRSIQADFVQEKHLKILVRPIVSTGTFTFQAPQSLRWEYKTSVPSILLMHNGRVKKFVEKDGRFVEDRGMGLDSMQVVLAEISNWLDGRFSDNKMFSVSFVDDRTVLLTPKDHTLAALISKIELKLSDRQGLLEGVTIFEGPDSSTTMTFKNAVLNKKIPVSVFTEK